MAERNFFENGDEAYSYATCLRTKLYNGVWVINRTKYSPTTSRHQNVAFACITGIRAIILDGIPKGATAQDLRRIAHETCKHTDLKPQILTDNSVVYDCANCSAPMVLVGDTYVTVQESAEVK